jgi:hypothetical protein
MIVKGKEVPFVNSAVKVEINKVSAMMFARAIKQEKHFFMAVVKASETGEEAAERIVTELEKQMVAEFPKVFPDAMPTGLPPDRGRFNHRIPLTEGAKPVARAPYRLAPLEKEVLKENIMKLLEMGHIRPSNSPYGSLVLFV